MLPPRGLMKRSAGVALLLIIVGPGCVREPADELAVWREFLPYADVGKQLETLSNYAVDLYLRVRPDDVGAPLWDLLETSASRGVRLRLWLQMPEVGTWLNERNVAEFGGFANELLDRAADNGIAIEWLIFDMEPDFAYAEALRRAAAAAPDDLLPLLMDHHDPGRFESATSDLRGLIDRLHARGVRIMVATLPWTIDDLYDRDAGLQDLFDTPLANLPWDQVCVMTYRPVFSELFATPLSPQFVASYARSVRDLFGPTAQVAIGNIGTPGLLVPVGYGNPMDVRADIAAARSAGVESISLFSLDGMLIEGGPDRWLEAADGPTWWSRSLDPATGRLRLALQWLDRLFVP
jgi:hypothetical protein